MFEPSRREAATELEPHRQGWVRSKHCTNGTCIEVLQGQTDVSVRDSKDLLANPGAPFPSIMVPSELWPVFLTEVTGKTSPGTNGSIFFDQQADGLVKLTAADSPVQLTYDAAEWAAFKAGVFDGEFGVPSAES